MWSKTIAAQWFSLSALSKNSNWSGQNASFRKVGVFHQLWAGSVLRFSYLFQVGWIVALLSRLCKDYLPGQQFKICGAVTKESATGRIPSAFLVWHLEIVQVFLKLILRRKASVTQISRLRLPFMQSPIIEHFQIFINNKRYVFISPVSMVAFSWRAQNTWYSISLTNKGGSLLDFGQSCPVRFSTFATSAFMESGSTFCAAIAAPIATANRAYSGKTASSF